MKLILVRHGETEENAARIHQGQTHGKLSQNGIEQAKKLALRLKDEKIDIIITSDLKRALHTAQEIAKHHKIKPTKSKEVREKTTGIFDGKQIDEYLRAFKASGKSRIKYKCPGGEDYLQVRERARKVFLKLLKKHKGKTVLVCSHGGFNRAFLSVILNRDLEEALENIWQDNTCVNVIDLSNPKKPKVETLNCTKHLR